MVTRVMEQVLTCSVNAMQLVVEVAEKMGRSSGDGLVNETTICFDLQCPFDKSSILPTRVFGSCR